MSHTTVRRIWAMHEVRPATVTAWPLRAEPTPSLEPREVVGVYLSPPVYAVALELGPSLGPTPTRPREAPTPGGADRVPASPLPALVRSLSDGPVEVPRPHRDVGFSRFLASLYKSVRPGAAVRVILTGSDDDWGRTHDRWRLRHPGFRFESVPDLPAWKRRVGGAVQRAAWYPAGRGPRGSRGESGRVLSLALESFRVDGRPFEWIATPREVRAGTTSQRLRYELSMTGHPSFRESAPGPSDGRGLADEPTVVRAMARTVLRRSLQVRRGSRLLVETWSGTLPAAQAFVLEAYRLGARPLLLLQDEPTYWAAATECRPELLARLADHRRAAVEHSDAIVSFFGPSDRERVHALPARARFTLCEYNDGLYRTAERAGIPTVEMALGRASESSARMYAVDLVRWRHELVTAARVDPRELRRRARRLVPRLRTGRSLRVRHPNGTDLELRLRQRPPLVSDGIAPRRGAADWRLVTLPAGVVNVAVDEEYAEGAYYSNVTSSVGLSGPVAELAGGRWTFDGGRLRRYSFDRGAEAFSESYARAGAGRDRPGSLSIGLNDHLESSPLLEDQGAGTVTLHIGRNDHVGGTNHASWWAWLFLRGADVTVDGSYMVRRGRLVD